MTDIYCDNTRVHCSILVYNKAAQVNLKHTLVLAILSTNSTVVVPIQICSHFCYMLLHSNNWKVVIWSDLISFCFSLYGHTRMCVRIHVGNVRPMLSNCIINYSLIHTQSHWRTKCELYIFTGNNISWGMKIFWNIFAISFKWCISTKWLT